MPYGRGMSTIISQKISACLWCDGDAEEKARFYTSVFPDARIVHIQRWGEAGPGPKGSVLIVTFEIGGVQFTALNAGPSPTSEHNDAISLMVLCDTQEEIDRYWERLTADGGEPIACSWLKDKYGVRWQIVPRRFFELVQGGDVARTDRVMRAMMQMVKMEIAPLEAAARG